MKRCNLFALLFACALMSLVANIALAQDDKKEDEKDKRIRALEKLVLDQNKTIEDLKTRMDKLEQGKEVKPPDDNDTPKIEIPTGDTNKTPAGGQPSGAKASFLPDIAVIGNHTGRFFSRHGDLDRDRFQLGELEISLQQPVYEGIDFHAQLTGGADSKFSVALEEAYVNIAKIGPFGAYLGLKRTNFGKLNPIHPHARLFADQPAAVTNFLGPDGLSGNGAAINYLFPIKNMFANLEVGFHHTDASDTGITPGNTFYPVGAGIQGDMPSARLWTSKEIGKGKELEIGGSHVYGRAPNGDELNVTGLDLTFRSFPGTFKRLLLQGEYFWHNRRDREFGTGSHGRNGMYGLVSYRPDQYSEYGFRYDDTRFPWPIDGHEKSYSLIYTRNLNEVTLVRLQYKYGDRTNDIILPAKKGFNELYLQFIWGAGSHTHPIQ